MAFRQISDKEKNMLSLEKFLSLGKNPKLNDLEKGGVASGRKPGNLVLKCFLAHLIGLFGA